MEPVAPAPTGQPGTVRVLLERTAAAMGTAHRRHTARGLGDDEHGGERGWGPLALALAPSMRPTASPTASPTHSPSASPTLSPSYDVKREVCSACNATLSRAVAADVPFDKWPEAAKAKAHAHGMQNPRCGAARADRGCPDGGTYATRLEAATHHEGQVAGRKEKAGPGG